MANNRIIIRRTSTAGRTPNTTASYATNSQYISAGELALNMADGIIYSSNGSTLIEIGANNTNVRVSNTLTVKAISANGSNGSAGQALYTNGTATYWAAAGGSGGGYYKGGTATIGTLASQGQNLFRVNANTLSFNTTISAGENAQATGPIAVAAGITLTVETGARVSIV